MVVQHNMSAMNANRQLGLVMGNLAKSSEKLSSGYRINRSADDAAGLSISEKMRTQIRGLNRASENIEDGISLCQVADGALNETIEIIQRMRELAVQSANGTNSLSDRQYIEMEIAQLKNEVDRIAQTTKFNDVVYPLNAPMKKNVIETIQSPSISGSDSHNIILREQTISFIAITALTHEGINYAPGDTVTVTGMTTNGNEIRFDGAVAMKMGNTYDIWYYDASQTATNNIDKSLLKVDMDGAIYYNSKITNSKWYYVYKNDGSLDPIACGPESDAADFVSNQGYHYFTADNLAGSGIPVMPTIPTLNTLNFGFLKIHAGASAAQADKIPIRIVMATCKGLGITDVRLDTEQHSTQALNLLDKAVMLASAYRSMFGATQNRLEHAKKINDNTAENTQAAESQIRDIDMAAEMMWYSNANILAQAGQSMLAQANQSNQGVYNLIA